MNLKLFVFIHAFLLATGIAVCQTDSLSFKSIYDQKVIYFSGNK